jgi:hypothetical protein
MLRSHRALGLLDGALPPNKAKPAERTHSHVPSTALFRHIAAEHTALPAQFTREINYADKNIRYN